MTVLALLPPATPTTDPRLEAALRLRERVFVAEQGVPLALERDALDAEAWHAIVIAESEALATGRLRLVSPDVAKIERVAVAASGRAAGLGRTIMAALEDQARQLGATRARLAAQETALGFYERLGYAAFGEPFVDAGLDHRWMERAL